MSSSESEFSDYVSLDSEDASSLSESLSEILNADDVESNNYVYEEEPEATEEKNAAYLKQVEAEEKLEEDLKKRFNEESQV
ncbi:hypothetical protein AC249_AIPGENE745 [Exaiptasia diaphana]|nr:hypothetical protein AC249_AIPGENE745 [Exaiptasia diaphana]